MPSREAHATSAVTWRGKLTWTNPCDPDLLYRTFYAVQQGVRVDPVEQGVQVDVGEKRVEIDVG